LQRSGKEQAQLRELLETAVDAARGAARVHRDYLGRVPVGDWAEKGIADFVTHVDRAAEAGIIDAVRRRFPDHRILAEEETSSAGVGAGTTHLHGWTWIIDPLDGTTNYLHGYPMYAVSIAVVHAGELVTGVVLNSANGQLWTATRGDGARLDGRPVSVSGIDRLQRSLIGTGFPFKALHLLPVYQQQLAAAVRSAAGVRRAGSAALDLCHVASGWFDGFWELSLAPWDVAAGTLIVREAGGIVTRLDPEDHDVVDHGAILAGNPAVHGLLGALLHDAVGDELDRPATAVARTGTAE
jgi:myo-inositol-1(or 4)-monophosphatase